MPSSQPRTPYGFNTPGLANSGSSLPPSSYHPSARPRPDEDYDMTSTSSFSSELYSSPAVREASSESEYASSPGLHSSGSQFGVPLLGASEEMRTSYSGSSRGYQSSTVSSRPYRAGSAGESATVSEKYALPSDPSFWRSDGPEADDYLHNPDPKRDHRGDHGGTILTARGVTNLGCLAILILALMMLFAGYPIYTEISKHTSTTLGAFNLGGINASGQVPQVIGAFQLIDPDTPVEAHTIVAENGETWELVFSDEWNTEGRTFYPGDDPFWESIDLHAWGTNDLEWYDHRQLTTKGGNLVLELAEIPKNNLDYLGASLQSWNKFCFSGGGRLEASIQLPGRASVHGLWPAFWTMGNLGRVGYGGTLDGLWPYSYDSCDVGTLQNQTLNDEPAISTTSGGDANFGNALSYMPGQRLSRCTCPDDETHPGPKHDDGSWVGRSAPEIDVIEAQTNVDERIGEVSLSVQWAPFNPHYEWENATHMKIEDPALARLNTYQGGVYQQSSSIVGITNQNCYETQSSGAPNGCFATYAYEYQTGSDGYIKWFNDDALAWTFTDGGMGPNAEAQVGNRIIPEEPMYILFNLAMSYNFGPIDLEGLADLWPVHMSVDYVRFYQHPDRKDIGCDPDHHPTAAYIERYLPAYHDPNITTWDQMTDSAPKPKNRLIDTC